MVPTDGKLKMTLDKNQGSLKMILKKLKITLVNTQERLIMILLVNTQGKLKLTFFRKKAKNDLGHGVTIKLLFNKVNNAKIVNLEEHLNKAKNDLG